MILQSVIDQENIINIIPKDFNSFYRVCFILDKINKIPNNANLWLIYLLTFYNENFDSYRMAQFTYCVDFLYSKVNLEKNELPKITEIISKIKDYCQNSQKENGSIFTSNDLSPKEELRNFIFIVNLLEDLIQDSIFYYNTDFKPLVKIFETIPFLDLDSIIDIINN